MSAEKPLMVTIISPIIPGMSSRENHCIPLSFIIRCTLSNQSEKIHYDEMVEAYQNAKSEYLRLHPEAHDMVLRYDPISHLLKPPLPSTETS